MTFFFNLDNLEEEANNDLNKFMTILEYLFYKKLPTKTFRIKRNMVGSSFILNLEPLFNIRNIDIAYIVQYIRLAARRDFNLYKKYGIKTLYLSYFPDINMQAIKRNPLLKITETDIHFLYEEQKRKTNGIRF